MVTNAWDVNGEARAALDAVVKDYGLAALSSPQILVSLLKDLLPDSPRESSALVAAAEVNVAGMLRDRLAQHISAGAAITQAAALLEERTALAPDACQWAARQMAEMIGMPMDAGPAPGETTPQPVSRPTTGSRPSPQTQTQVPPQPPWPGPQPGPQPDPHPSPPARPRSAAVAAWAAVICALSVPLQVLEKGGVTMSYGWFVSLSGLILLIAGLLTLRGRSRHLGVGLIFGAALATVPDYVEQSVLSGYGGGIVAASVFTTVTALIAAVSSIVYFAREIRGGNLRVPLAAAYCLAAIGFVVAFNPGDLQYHVGGTSWATYPGMVGPGVAGRYLFAGIVSILALCLPAVIAGLLPPGTGVRAGLITGWLAMNAASLVGLSLAAIQPDVRPAPALYACWAVWVIALVLGVALLARNRGRRVVNAGPVPVS